MVLGDCGVVLGELRLRLDRATMLKRVGVPACWLGDGGGTASDGISSKLLPPAMARFTWQTSNHPRRRVSPTGMYFIKSSGLDTADVSLPTVLISSAVNASNTCCWAPIDCVHVLMSIPGWITPLPGAVRCFLCSDFGSSSASGSGATPS